MVLQAAGMMLMAAGFFSCDSGKTPEGILKQHEMVPILLEVYLAEGQINELRIKRDSAMMMFEVYEQKIFEKYHVSDSTYKASLVYYYDHPDQLESIYETVLDSLNLMEKKLEEKKDEGEGKEDDENKLLKELKKKEERQTNEDQPSKEKLNT